MAFCRWLGDDFRRPGEGEDKNKQDLEGEQAAWGTVPAAEGRGRSCGDGGGGEAAGR